jgi:hypothetical protein
VRTTGWPIADRQSPREAFVGECDTAKLRAAHVADAIVKGERFIHEGMICREQIGDAAILEQDAL